MRTCTCCRAHRRGSQRESVAWYHAYMHMLQSAPTWFAAGESLLVSRHARRRGTWHSMRGRARLAGMHVCMHVCMHGGDVVLGTRCAEELDWQQEGAMYVCMYVCTLYWQVHTCTHAHMHACTHAHMHTCSRLAGLAHAQVPTVDQEPHGLAQRGRVHAGPYGGERLTTHFLLLTSLLLTQGDRLYVGPYGGELHRRRQAYLLTDSPSD